MESPKTHNPASQPTEEKPVQPSADISLSPKEEELSEQMYPLIERSLFHSVTNNFQHLADIIFPVMGPAIRKAIQEAMKKLTESVNHSLENSLSPRSIAWRIQALFTGKSYGDIVLQHSFIYQVNHIFLIHKKTGLLIRQVSHEAAAERESDLISAMLSAIRDFIRDSFDAEESDEVQQIHVGNQAIWIEASPHAILAAVIEGEAPLSLRDLMVKTIEQIHREYTAELDAFEGETEPFALADGLLKKCLLSREKPLNRKKPNSLLILTLLIVALAGYWITNRSIQNHRWNQLITTLDDQPGIVVLSDHHRGRQFDARLLWDEEAIDPAMLIAHSGLKPERIRLIKIRYRSDDPEIAASRFRKIYHVPEKVKIIKTDSSLIIKGTAPWKWVDPFRRKATMIPTAVPLDLSGLIASEEQLMNDIRNAIQETSFRFVTGTTELYPEDSNSISQLRQQLIWLDRISLKTNHSWLLSVIGLTDSTTTAGQNIALALKRSRLFTRKLLPQALTSVNYRNYWTVNRDTTLHPIMNKDIIFTLKQIHKND